MTTIALLHSTIRAEEKLLLEAAHSRAVELRPVDVRTAVFSAGLFPLDFDIALERSVSTVKGTYAVAYIEACGRPAVNSLEVARNCQDKFQTSLLLERVGIPTPRFALVFEPEPALEAVEALGGFPVVLKPPLGSWGRLLAKVNDRDALEALLEHKDVLGTPPQKAYYLQEYVRKPGRDIRAFVAGGETICAIYRESGHWITNTARGAVARNCPVDDGLRSLCARVSGAVGGGLLAVDVFETSSGLTVNEVNHTMEFRNSEGPTGVSIAGAVIDYCLSRVEGRAR